jgi:hypothetical protein
VVGTLTNGRTIEFGRREVKYLIDRSRRTALTRDLVALMRRDAHAGSDGTYVVRSLYFDSPDFVAYHEKLAGEAVRHKLRVRTYGEDAEHVSRVRLEVKSRYLSFIHKISVDLSPEEYAEVDRALKNRTMPPARLLESHDVSKEFFRLQRLYNFEPKIVVQYRRQAFERLEINRTRVNFDDQLMGTRILDLLGPLRAARPVLQAGHSILEIKVDGGLPFWLHQLIGKYELCDRAISKYCLGVRSEARFTHLARSEDPVTFAYAG